MICRKQLPSVFLLFLLAFVFGPKVSGEDLYVGSARTSITPSEPVVLSGQRYSRIAREVQTPVRASAVAIDSGQGNGVRSQAVMVSCDLVAIPDEIHLQRRVRQAIRSRVSNLQGRSIFLSDTHTHTGPLMEAGKYDLPEKGIMQPDEYTEFLVDRLVGVIEEAWKNRNKGGVSWGLGHAVVGRNRRATYSDGSGTMYGDTSTEPFSTPVGPEGGEVLVDQTVKTINSLWEKKEK